MERRSTFLRRYLSKIQGCALLYLAVFVPAAFSELPDHASNEQVLRAIRQTTDLLDTSRNAWVPQAYCYSCHHEAMQFRIDRLAAEHGLPVDRNAENEHLRRAVGQSQPLFHDIPLFGVDATARGQQLIDPALLPGIALISMHDLGVPASTSFEATAQMLVKLQRPEGYWATTDARPPQIASRFTQTVFAMEAINDYLPEQAAAEKRAVLARAKHWLLTSPPRDNEDRAMQLFGLKTAGASKQEMEPIAKFLIREQRPDGGWAQLKTRESDAYATGKILVVLQETGALRTSDPVYQRGVAYLLKTQAPDGSWHVKTRLLSPAELSPPPFDFKLPYDDDYIISYFGTGWADQALMLTLPQVRRPEKIFDATKFKYGLIEEVQQPAWVDTVLFGTTADLQHLLDNGLSPNATTPGGTPVLQVAATNLAKTRLLLSRGADVNYRTKNGFSALSAASSARGTMEVVRYLLDHGAKIERPEKNDKGGVDTSVPTPLFLAVGTGEIETARLLIQRGDPLESIVTSNKGRTPLTNAIDMGDAQMVRFLIESGADIQGDTLQAEALQHVVLADYRDVLSVLIEKGFNVNATDEYGMTPLHYAAMTDYGDTEIVRKLLAAGAKTDAKDKGGETPGQAAARLHLTQLADALGSPAAN